MANKCIFLASLASMTFIAEGTQFLKATPQHVSDTVSATDIQTSLLEEIEGSLGVGIASKRVNDIKAVVGPMFTTLPKNQHGHLDHASVRYVLHRVFVQRHGWSIEGLDAAGAAWNSSTPTGILKNQVPAYIEQMFENRLGGRGLGLQELAVFAATVEHLIHNEAIGNLGAALNAHNLLPTEPMTVVQADEVIDTYMAAYIIGEKLSTYTQEKAKLRIRQMPNIYPHWDESVKFFRSVRQEVADSMKTVDQQFSFAMLVKVAETIAEQFGRFQDADCQGLKTSLMKMEDRGTGRVRLSDFYRGALDAKDFASWQFQESIAYLRQLGALDESNGDEPRVMIPNYLLSQTNCIASSDYYSVCCINECENLVGHLEKDIAAPEASPERIVELISALPSSSVAAPRQLSSTLLNRLEKIGADHGGSVQLHSRLFAQWMHHAYPRECPFPHMSGTTVQASPEAYGVKSAVASKEELVQFTSVDTLTKVEQIEDIHDLMMWSHEEEFIVARPELVPGNPAVVNGIRVVFGLAAVVSLGVALFRTAGAGMSLNTKEQKFMV